MRPQIEEEKIQTKLNLPDIFWRMISIAILKIIIISIISFLGIRCKLGNEQKNCYYLLRKRKTTQK